MPRRFRVPPRPLTALFSLTVLCLFAPAHLVAQVSGAIDPAFTNSSGANGVIHAAVQTPEEKIYVGGAFTVVRGGLRNRIARLDSDGRCDKSFDPGLGANGDVLAIALQADGKIVIGGDFTQVNGVTSRYIARIRPDGTLDTGFTPPALNNRVFSIHLLPDGKLHIGGDFTTINSASFPRIARLHDDGRLDTSFVTASGANARVRTITSDSHGRILIGGDFATYRGFPRPGLARINGNGAIDSTFVPGTGTNGPVHSISIRSSDGKIYAGGNFTTYNGTGRASIVRINGDGSLDDSFVPGHSRYGDVRAIIHQSDDSVVIGGNFFDYYQPNSQGIARLDDTGGTDALFQSPVIGVLALSKSSDGSLIVAGYFENVDLGIAHILRMNADGSVENSFLSEEGLGASAHISDIARGPDGSIFIGGIFYAYGNVPVRGLAKLDPDGRLDPNFRPADSDGSFNAISLLPDGKILVAGQFNRFGDFHSPGVARLLSNGGFDRTFDSRFDSSYAVQDVGHDGNGKYYIVGGFSQYHGVPRRGIVRVHADGRIDSGFDPGPGQSFYSAPFLVLPGGKILVRENVDFSGSGRLRRLNQDGSIDNTFISGVGTDDGLYALAIQSDGKILVGGAFAHYNGSPANKLVRLAPDGAVDTTFSGSVGIDASVYTSDGIVRSILPQDDGRIWIGGNFEVVNGAACVDLARLKSDGTLDLVVTEEAGGGGLGGVLDLADQGEGRLLVGGSFTSFAGTEHCILLRIFTKSAQAITFGLEPEYSATEQFPLPAVGGSSQQEVSFEVLSGPAVISGQGQLRFTGTGMVTIRATQRGDGDYFDAPPAEFSFDVVPPLVDLSLAGASLPLIGRDLYSPTPQILSILEARRKTVISTIHIGNRTLLPDQRAMSRVWMFAGRGNRKIAINYFDGSGAVTAGLVAGRYKTPPLDGSTADQSLTVVAKSAAARRSNRQRNSSATLSIPITAWVENHPEFSDSAQMLISFRSRR